MAFVVSPSEDRRLQGAGAEQESEHPWQDEAGTEDRESKGTAHPRSCSPCGVGCMSRTKTCAVTCKDHIWSEDPQSCFSL